LKQNEDQIEQIRLK